MTPADPIAVALLVARELDTLGILYTTGGSIASSIAGEPRLAIIRVQGSRLDRDYLSANAPALEVADLLARALEEGG